MQYGALPDSSKKISRIICGADRGSLLTPAFLDRAFERGITAFDTARCYVDSEAAIGTWLQSRRLRDEVFLITKGALPEGSTHRLTRKEVARDLETSLRELRTDRVDLYLFHFDAPRVPIEEVLAISEWIQDSGKAALVSGSNFSHQRVRDIRAAGDKRAGIFTAISAQYSLPVMVRPMWPGTISVGGDAGRPARDWYRAEGVGVLAYSCLGRGFFTPQFEEALAMEALPPGTEVVGRHRDVPFLFSVWGPGANGQVYWRAKELAKKRSVTPAQIGIAYVLQSGSNVFATIGWSDDARLDENLGALDVTLDEGEIRWLEQGFQLEQAPAPRL